MNPEASTQQPATAGTMSNGNPDHNSFDPQTLSQLENGFINTNAMPGILPGQPFIGDPTMATLPIHDANLMMPFMMAANNSAPSQLQPNSISEDDIALYDRQIRLWGVAAQAKIQNASILLITIKALANEVAKNLVLAGVGSLTILDDGVVSESDLGAQFFLSEDDNLVGQNRAQAAYPAIQKLNPRVQVHVDSAGVKSKGPSYFGAFDIVIATDLDPDSFNLINTATRINGNKFYAASSYGMYGFIFNDLIEHDYIIERQVGNVATEIKQESRTRAAIGVSTKKEGSKNLESVTKRELYSTWFLASDMATLPPEYLKSRRRLKSVNPALSCLRALWEFMQTKGGRVPANRDDLKTFTQIATTKHKMLGLPSETLSSEFLRSFLQNLGSEIAPVTAILGGQLAQDVINVLGQKEQPIQNMVIFDGNTMEALMYPLHPEGMLGSMQLSMGGDSLVGGTLPGNDMIMAGVGVGMGMGMDMRGMGFDASAAMTTMPVSNFPMAPIMSPMGGMSGDIAILGNQQANDGLQTQIQGMTAPNSVTTVNSGVVPTPFVQARADDANTGQEANTQTAPANTDANSKST